jgi:hypothetical protein
MRYSTIVEEFSARPLYILAAFLVLLFVLHLVLVFWMKLGDVAWKRLDYVWLGTAVLGLLTASAQADHLLSKRYLEIFEGPRTESAYQLLRGTIDTDQICLPRRRSAASAPNFDERNQEQQALCKRGKEIASKMPKHITEPFPPLEQTGYESLGIESKYETGYVESVDYAAERYRQQQRSYAESLSAGKLSSAEETVTILGPLLLAFALALRITKVTGDIRNARIKNTSQF